MKLWIDDIRPPPDDSWTWAKSRSEAAFQTGIALGKAMVGEEPFEVRWRRLQSGEIPVFEDISFDHDLGGDDTSMWVAKKIESLAHEGIKPPVWHVHSANPVGRMNLEAALKSADRLWEEHQNKEGRT